MKFTPVAIIALAAGVQAGAFKQNEPAAKHGRGIVKAVGTAATGASTGVHPIMTGISGVNTTVPVISSSTAPVIPVSVPSSHASSAVQSSAVQSSAAPGVAQTSAAQPGAVQPGAVQPGAPQSSAARPSASGFVPSSPGVKVTVPMVGAALGSVAYGALVFLA